MLTSYAIPLTLICLLYFGMLFGLWKSVSGSGACRQGLRGKKRVTRMVVVVVGVFAVCWLPIQIVLLLKSIHVYNINDVTVAIQITSHVLGYMNSCVNPILYAFLSENFRKAFRKVIQCRGAYAVHHNHAQTLNNHHEPLVTHVNDHEGQTKETALLTTLCENGGNNHKVASANTKSFPRHECSDNEDQDILIGRVFRPFKWRQTRFSPTVVTLYCVYLCLSGACTYLPKGNFELCLNLQMLKFKPHSQLRLCNFTYH
ncbi:unnamed protein product [Allacma fusca]|uniref:G-protein coupled receptors family 1 profile domain-containing protein n=1 Tax=Allacma fusca TaxID=39272 RepID=A0A8J2L112_9HEXA|nr:unnamed protein product [Allacma fusca]